MSLQIKKKKKEGNKSPNILLYFVCLCEKYTEENKNITPKNKGQEKEEED